MLTRRENLLIRPWQERKYINHRIKVERALPAIDNSPPPLRQHVFWKMKRYQKEKERWSQIATDNFTLLQHLYRIGRTSRVDNIWEEPPPNFLNRVGIYSCRRSARTDTEELPLVLEEPKNRKDRCYGCSPQRYVVKENIPEERIPFAPPRKHLSRKLQSPPDTAPEKQIKEKVRDGGEEKTRRGSSRNEKAGKGRERRPDWDGRSGGAGRSKRKLRGPSQSLLLNRGPLTLRVRFPPDSTLIFTDRGQERILSRQYCSCAALSAHSSSTVPTGSTKNALTPLPIQLTQTGSWGSQRREDQEYRYHLTR